MLIGALAYLTLQSIRCTLYFVNNLAIEGDILWALSGFVSS